ncbi:accessory gene regulator ArgB-like protein [Moorella sp. Hama-1]|uniref:accessory gene regulator ArgB-like protein n=1 Tax=Moorella sp. Hama-1 TaxID=2138101 RepID=UPI000D65904A|nr:accessory gene regulator B family protein [Moorella sp. Hama-1]MDN5362657.1 accessory regulator [Moorella sp. (in: firmicutes)]BCV20175.1 accessory gene regulator B [Moorella sp. Hama-1]
MLKLSLTRPAAAYLKEHLHLNSDEEAIALFGLQMLVYTVTGFLSICLAGWLLGVLALTLVVTLAAASLRLFAGGAHSRSPLTCNLLGMIVAPLLGKLAALAAPLITPAGLLVIILAGFIVAVVVAWRRAPVDSPAKPITSPAERRKLRSLSLLLVILIAALQVFILVTLQSAPLVLALSLGLWWQTFSLTRAGHWFAILIDNLMAKGGITA